jgi:hypothetical protein
VIWEDSINNKCDNRTLAAAGRLIGLSFPREFEHHDALSELVLREYDAV